MRNKIIASLVAGTVLVGAGFVTAMVSAPGAAIAQEDNETDHEGFIPRALGFLGGVLDDLVGAGEISQDDADTVLDAVAAAMEEAKAERQEIRQAIKEAFEDGELTVDEASILPDDHGLFSEKFDEAWEDGILTKQEIRELNLHPRREAFRRGVRFGALLDDGGIDADEYAALGTDHPLKRVDIGDALNDGIITLDELRAIWQQLHEDSGS